MAPLPNDVVILLQDHIESLERLQVLLHLVRTSGARAPAAVAATLRLAVEPTEQHLARLCASGLLAVTLGNELRYAYRTSSKALADTVARLERACLDRMEDVARAIGEKDV